MQKLKTNRNDLAKFLPDQRSIRAFENLFSGVDQNNSTILQLIDEVSTSSENANSNSIMALSLIESLKQIFGEYSYIRVINATGSTIPKGSVVSISSNGSISLYLADQNAAQSYAIGLATMDIANGDTARIITFGKLSNLDTSAFSVGDLLYVSSSTAGALTNIKPSVPNLIIPIGIVTASSATTGEILVLPINGFQCKYAEFSKSVTASLSAANTAYPITFDTVSIANGISIGTTASQIIFSKTGLYRINATIQLASTGSNIKQVYVWLRKNGVDIPNTSTTISIESATAMFTPMKSNLVSVNSGDYIELCWAATDNSVSISASASTAFSPANPACTLNIEQIQQ